MRIGSRFLVIGLAMLAVGRPASGDGEIIATMDELRFQTPADRGAAALVEGKVGRAVHFRFEDGARSVFFTSHLRGTQLRQNLVLIPRGLGPDAEPDLVTMFFGGNDWDAGMRGEEFQRACDDAVDRIRRATNGKADVLLMTANPSAARWTETAGI